MKSHLVKILLIKSSSLLLSALVNLRRQPGVKQKVKCGKIKERDALQHQIFMMSTQRLQSYWEKEDSQWKLKLFLFWQSFWCQEIWVNCLLFSGDVLMKIMQEKHFLLLKPANMTKVNWSAVDCSLLNPTLTLVLAQTIFSYATVMGGYVWSISAPSVSRTCLFWRDGRKLTFSNHMRARLDSEEAINTTRKW